MNDSVLRYGVYLPPFGPFGDPKILVELAVRAEAAGWDGLFLWDHVIHDTLPIGSHYQVQLPATEAEPHRIPV
ncbi:MAG TPA: hypothetical protein VE198_14020 [Actinoallomurus sp.]|nr:hypothetical protein [Actinoallomurus sp.]